MNISSGLTPVPRTLLFTGSHGHRVKWKPHSLEVKTLPRLASLRTPTPALEASLWAWATPHERGALPSTSATPHSQDILFPLPGPCKSHLFLDPLQIQIRIIPPGTLSGCLPSHSEYIPRSWQWPTSPRMWPPGATSPLLGPLPSSPWSGLHGRFWSPPEMPVPGCSAHSTPAGSLSALMPLLIVTLWSNSTLLGAQIKPQYQDSAGGQTRT